MGMQAVLEFIQISPFNDRKLRKYQGKCNSYIAGGNSAIRQQAAIKRGRSQQWLLAAIAPDSNRQRKRRLTIDHGIGENSSPPARGRAHRCKLILAHRRRQPD
jgi:hypothetical protein